RPVEDDSLGVAGQYHRVPLAQGLVVQFEPVRTPLSLTHPRKPTAGGGERARPTAGGDGRGPPRGGTDAVHRRRDGRGHRRRDRHSTPQEGRAWPTAGRRDAAHRGAGTDGLTVQRGLAQPTSRGASALPPGRGIPSRGGGHQGPYGPEELLPPLNSLTF